MREVCHRNVWVFSLFLSCLFVLPYPPAHAEAIEKLLKPAEIRGGVIVHLGCGDGKFIADLYRTNALVHALVTSADNVAKARQYIKSKGLYGKVSVEQWRRDTLPYVDNSVNLLIARDPGRISRKEIVRVLCPGGVAHIRTGDPLNRHKLDSAPVFDGMIADDGRLLISLQDGSILCMR